MPQINVVGFKRFDFKNDRGDQISGTSLFYLSPIDPRSGMGDEIKKITVPSSVMRPSDFNQIGMYHVEQWDGRICSCKFLGK